MCKTVYKYSFLQFIPHIIRIKGQGWREEKNEEKDRKMKRKRRKTKMH